MAKMILIALALAAAEGAEAASRMAQNRCNDAVRTMRQAGRKHFEGKEVSPLEVKNAIAHYNSVGDYFLRANAQLGQVPKGELDWADPQLKECHDDLVAWKNYLAELKGKIQGAGAGAAVLGPFLAEVKPYERSLFTLAAAHLDPAADVFNGRKPEEVRQISDDMAKVEKLCGEKFPAAGKNPPAASASAPGGQYQRVAGVAIPASFSQSADNWCWIARSRKELIARGAGNRSVHVEGYGNVQLVLPMLLKKYSAQNPGMDTWVAAMLLDPKDYFDKLAKAQAADDAASGTASGAKDGGAVAGWLKELQAKVDEAAPQVKFPPAGGHDAALEKAAAKALAGIYPDAKVAASQMDAAGWTIEKNGLGIPLSRFRSGQIAFSVPGSKWCLQRTFNWVETYSGAGNYEPPGGASILGGTRFLACP